MASSDEITSTERLLEAIRKKAEPEVPAEAPRSEKPEKEKAKAPKKGKTLAFPGGGLGSKKRSIAVGVDIGSTDLRLVKVARSPDRRWRLLDYKKVSLAHLSSRQRPEFTDFVRSEITGFSEPRESAEFWANMSAAQVTVQYFVIPKVKKEQVESTVRWMAKKEGYSERESILDFEVRGEVIDQGIAKLSVMACIAPRSEVEGLARLFSDMGIQLTGISITPFAIQNIFRAKWLAVPEETVANLFIGNDFSRIDIYSNGNLVMTRAIKAGLNSMMESLIEEYKDRTRSAGGGYEILDMAQARRICFSLSPDAPRLTENEAGYNLNDNEIFSMIEPALERLTRQVERTFEYYVTTIRNGRVSKIFVSSIMDVYKPLVTYIGSQLGIETDVLDPLGDAMSELLGGPPQVSISERTALVPALGLALSDNAYTPNLLFTYSDKEKAGRIASLNRKIFIGFIAAVLVCAGILVIERQATVTKKETLARLEQQLGRYSPPIDQNLLLQMAAKVKQQKAREKEFTTRYLSMAVLSELTALTPDNIKLLSLRATFPIDALSAASSPAPAPAAKAGNPPGQAAPAPAASASKEPVKPRTDTIVIEGLVFGDAKTFEADLASYVVKVDASPLFEKTAIQKSTPETFKRGNVLFFVITTQLQIG